MKYYLKPAGQDHYIDLESTSEVEATLAALPIASTEAQKESGYGVYWWRYMEPSEWVQNEVNHLVKTKEEDRFNIENKVVSKWV